MIETALFVKTVLYVTSLFASAYIGLWTHEATHSLFIRLFDGTVTNIQKQDRGVTMDAQIDTNSKWYVFVLIGLGPTIIGLPLSLFVYLVGIHSLYIGIIAVGFLLPYTAPSRHDWATAKLALRLA